MKQQNGVSRAGDYRNDRTVAQRFLPASDKVTHGIFENNDAGSFTVLNESNKLQGSMSERAIACFRDGLCLCLLQAIVFIEGLEIDFSGRLIKFQMDSSWKKLMF